MLTCEQCREAVSARFDGEPTGAAAEAVATHLRGCNGCRAFALGLHRLDDVPGGEPEVPDRSARILAAVRADRPARPRRPAAARIGAARVGLGAIALVEMAAALADLVAGVGVHSLRDLGAFQLALAVGFLVAALRPETATGLAPTAAALAACLLIVVGLDLAIAQTSAAGEAGHMIELVGIALVWQVAHERPARPVRVA